MKRTDDNDSDEYEEMPRRRRRRQQPRSNNRRLWIVLGITSGLLVLAVLGCVGLILYKTKPSEHKREVEQAADGFLTTLAAGWADTAYGQTSSDFRSRQTLQEFQAFLKRYPALTSSRTREFGGFSLMTGAGGPSGSLKLDITSKNGPLAFTLVFINENGRWVVDQITIP